MNPNVKLSKQEQASLDRIRERLQEEGLRVSDERLILALLKAAVQLPGDALLALLKDGLSKVTPEHDPVRRRKK